MDGFATCWLASYEPASGRFRWASAGHPPPVVVTGDGASLLAGGPDPPLGLVARARVDRVGGLEPGETLIAYSDGLVERRGEALTDSLARLVELAARLGPVDADLPDRLIEGIPDARGPRDDLCVLVLQRS